MSNLLMEQLSEGTFESKHNWAAWLAPLKRSNVLLNKQVNSSSIINIVLFLQGFLIVQKQCLQALFCFKSKHFSGLGLLQLKHSNRTFHKCIIHGRRCHCLEEYISHWVNTFLWMQIFLENYWDNKKFDCVWERSWNDTKWLDRLLKPERKTKKNNTTTCFRILFNNLIKCKRCLLRKIKAPFLHSKVALRHQVWLLTGSMIKSCFLLSRAQEMEYIRLYLSPNNCGPNILWCMENRWLWILIL